MDRSIFVFDVQRLIHDAWTETEHPRVKHGEHGGEFTAGSGGGGASATGGGQSSPEPSSAGHEGVATVLKKTVRVRGESMSVPQAVRALFHMREQYSKKHSDQLLKDIRLFEKNILKTGLNPSHLEQKEWPPTELQKSKPKVSAEKTETSKAETSKAETPATKSKPPAAFDPANYGPNPHEQAINMAKLVAQATSKVNGEPPDIDSHYRDITHMMRAKETAQLANLMANAHRALGSSVEEYVAGQKAAEIVNLTAWIQNLRLDNHYAKPDQARKNASMLQFASGRLKALGVPLPPEPDYPEKDPRGHFNIGIETTKMKS